MRIQVADGVTVAASALRYDAECTREVASSICAHSRRVRAQSASLREEHAALHAQGELVLRRAARLLSR